MKPSIASILTKEKPRPVPEVPNAPGAESPITLRSRNRDMNRTILNPDRYRPRMVREYPESPTGTPAMPARFQSLAGRLADDARCDGPEASGCPPKRARIAYGPRERESRRLIPFRADSASWARTGTFGTASRPSGGSSRQVSDFSPSVNRHEFSGFRLLTARKIR